MSRDNADAQHAPTPARLQTARIDGDVTISRALSGAMQLLGMLVIIWMLLGHVGQQLKEFARITWSDVEIASANLQWNHWSGGLMSVVVAVLPIMVIGLIFGVLSAVSQTGPLWLPQKVALDPMRLSPGHWFQRVFSPSHWVASLMALPQLLIVAVAAAFSGYLNWKEIMTLGGFPVDVMVTRLAGLILKIGFQTALILFAFGLIDYGLRWTARQRRLRMSDEELRQEQRMQSGNPQTSDRRRRLHRAMTLGASPEPVESSTETQS